MQAGKLRHRLEIQTNAQTVNSVGEREDDWVTETTRHGSIEPLSGREYFSAQQVHADVTHKGTIRYYPITTAHRVKLGTRVFEVASVMHTDGRKIETTFLAKETA